MDLWNEYEGRTIDGRFPLERLLSPEGRSAFFSTSISSGKRTVIRLIESHYDDDQILARWQAMTDLKQNYLLNLHKFGSTTMDDTSLVYAVLEPAEGSLSDILSVRPLTQPETRELAQSLIPALHALHSIGLVHEHVQPGNILAVGETIKLRSDCIREAPEGPEGDRLRARDVHDLTQVLLQALTRSTNPSAQLPPPFQQIIQNGLTNRWGLAEIAHHLTQTVAPPQAPQSPTTPYRRPPSEPQPPLSTPAASPLQADLPLSPASSPISAPHLSEPRLTEPDRTYIPVQEVSSPTRRPVATIAALVLIILCYLLWHLTHHQTNATQATASAPTTQTQVAAQAPVATVVKPTATVSAPNPNASWRVVAFTYNREPQAQAKASHLAREHRDLQFAVFTPNGHAPWLVTVNGEMSREQALSLQNRLRGRGLPRDLYARNYPASSR